MILRSVLPLVRQHTVRNFSSLPSIFSPTAEHDELRQMVRKWTAEYVEPQALANNRSETFNIDLFRKLGELGLLGITVSEKYGGAGMDASAAVICNEELAYSDPAFCLSYLAHSMLFVNNLARNGSEEQKLKLLPSSCSGEKIGGLCMSEAGSGTDVFAMKTQAKKKSGKWILNGSKMWITNGTVADSTPGDIFLVYARTGHTGDPRKDTSQFIVEKSIPGFSVGSKITDKCGMRASGTAELVFEDIHIGEENLVGEEGRAHLCMMRNLELERLTLAAMSVGIARRCIDVMNSYATERKAFGQPIRNFGQNQAAIATSYAEYMAVRCYLYEVASRTKLDESGMRIDSDGVKLAAGPMAKNVADRAIQVLGGNGYIGEYVVERLWRDAKLLEIGGGTNEALQANMTRDLKKIRLLS